MTTTLITDYLGRGLLSARPASPDVGAGALALYYATDTTIVSHWNGSAWADLSLPLSATHTWSAAQRGAVVTLTDATTIATDLDLGNNFAVTLAGNRTLGNPSHITAGQAGQIIVKQDGTGSRTLAYASDWKFAGGTAPTLSTAAGALDILSYFVVDTTHIVVSSSLNFS